MQGKAPGSRSKGERASAGEKHSPPGEREFGEGSQAAERHHRPLDQGTTSLMQPQQQQRTLILLLNFVKTKTAVSRGLAIPAQIS